jgi:CheY-like chemotaxis protein
MTSHEKTHTTIRMGDEQIKELLDRLDAPCGRPADQRRRHQRYEYRCRHTVVFLPRASTQSGTPYLVSTRNISESGLSFLHGGFVYVGTRCQVRLLTIHGSWEDVHASVVHCRYLEKNVHEVGVRFDVPIDPSMFSFLAVRTRVLLAEDDPSITRLATFYLQQFNAEVDHATNGREAVARAKGKRYDIILMDVDMPVLNGLEATRELRRCGYSGLIVAATALTEPADRKQCLEAGCDQFLAKPFTSEDLSRLLLSLREEPLFSTFHHDPGMAKLVCAYVADLPTKVRAVEEGIAVGDR